MDRLRRNLTVLALAGALAAVAAGCGGEKTDVSKGIDSFNDRLRDQGVAAEFDCPKEVDGGEGTEFECTLKQTEGDKTAKVQFVVKKEDGDYVVFEKDQRAMERAIQTVIAQQAPQQGQGGGGQQPPGQQPAQPGQQPAQPGQQPAQPAQPGQQQPTP